MEGSLLWIVERYPSVLRLHANIPRSDLNPTALRVRIPPCHAERHVRVPLHSGLPLPLLRPAVPPES